MNVGKEQQNAPFTNVGNLASLLGTINAPSTVSSQKQLSPLGQIATLGNAVVGGAKGLAAFGKTPMGESILKQIPSLGGILGGSGSGSGLTQALKPGTYPLAGGGSMVINPDGYRMITQADGTVTVTDAQGNALSAQDQQEYENQANGGNTSGDTGGGGTGGGDNSAGGGDSGAETNGGDTGGDTSGGGLDSVPDDSYISDDSYHDSYDY
jgi:hypothetical protein